jgi:hypothetical protein
MDRCPNLGIVDGIWSEQALSEKMKEAVVLVSRQTPGSLSRVTVRKRLLIGHA